MRNLKDLCRTRSSHWKCSTKNVFLKFFVKFTGKHLCWSHFFNEVACLGSITLLRKRLQHRCFPVNFTKSSKQLFYRTLSGDCFYKALTSKPI